jgi:hypothetical protein
MELPPHQPPYPRRNRFGRVTRLRAVAIVGTIVVETVAVPNGWKHELKRDANARVVGIVWTMNIPAGEFAEFAFVARNPPDRTEVVWTLRQRFSDGTVSDWTKGPNGVRPTSMTKLSPRPGQ